MRTVCPNCGKAFDVDAYRMASGRRPCCSKSCAASNRKGPRAARWNGGRYLNHNGYVRVMVPGHPHADESGYVFEHRLIVERVIGKILRISAPVHHRNENKADNRNANLVVCQDDQYHRLLHARQRVLDAGGHPAHDKICSRCKALQNRAEFPKRAAKYDGLSDWCKGCTRTYKATYARETRATRRAS